MYFSFGSTYPFYKIIICLRYKGPGTVANLPSNPARIPIIDEAGKGDNQPTAPDLYVKATNTDIGRLANNSDLQPPSPGNHEASALMLRLMGWHGVS